MPAISITALTDPVAIVHIPITLAQSYTTKIYWTLDRAAAESGEFFNITSNRIEMAIFGSLELITHEWSNLGESEILISTSWRVFEISSGDEGEVGNYDSPHLRHVSPPLAKAGISILYQSSYFTDFLLVKETDFEKAASVFAGQGWHIDPSLPLTPRRRSLITPLTPTFPSTSFSPSRSSPPPPTSPEITVLPSPLAFVGFSKSAEARFSERVRKFLVWPERCASSSSYLSSGDEYDGSEYENESEIEVSKLVSPGNSRTATAEVPSVRSRPFVSFTRTEDGASLVTEVRVLRGMFPPDEEEGMDLQSGGELELGWTSTDESTCRSEPELDLADDDDADEPILSRASRDQEEADDRPFDFDEHRMSFNAEAGVENASELGVEGIPIRWSGREVRHPEERGKKRCLQLDLRVFGHGESEGAYHLDKSGLVTRFSNLLTSSSRPIRMLYSSTFHTANILVEARDVKKAKKLLERRRRSAEWS
ncbi:hypothetical protein I316_03081 [Kwoniella heveanensis BCC8398]|uniref:CASTOR ACT domain-containing protein n=1 Tax=Kwoniella heveanensis BCC8398 TaxID=1296120 RepID=A0A1B9GVJ7_9TREE|nr:hypothetical protein I316_03081 [Kwoniella heveanensis BCC8398]